MTAPFLERRGAHVRIRIRLTPGARQEGFGGVFADADDKVWLKASVRPVPQGGKANQALLALLSRAAGVASGRVTLAAGELSRTKTVQIDDCSDSEAQRLGSLASG